MAVRLCLIMMIVCANGCTFRSRPNLAEAADCEKLLQEAAAAVHLGSEKDLSRAYYALRLAEELSPQDGRIQDGLGCVAWRKGQFAEAKTFFERSVQLSPDYDGGYAHLALAAERSGQHAEAAKLFRKALELRPLNFRTRNNYAVFRLGTAGGRADIREAYEELQKAGAGSDSPLIEANIAAVRRILEKDR